jgi:hypothetical protein
LSQNLAGSEEGKGCDDVPRCILKDSLYPLDAPRALFSVRFKEDLRAEDLSIELFKDWLRAIPVAAEEMCIEGSFKCFSTLVFITVPLSMRAYIPDDPAIFYLGTTLSPMAIPLKKQELSSIQTEEGVEGLISRAEYEEGKEVVKSIPAPSANTRTKDKTSQLSPKLRGIPKSLAKNIEDTTTKLGNMFNSFTATTPHTLWDSQTMWDDYADVDSQSSSPTVLEDPWYDPVPLRPSSGNCSPRDRSPSLGGCWTPKSSQEYIIGYKDGSELPPYTTTGDRVTRKPLGPRQSKVASDLASGYVRLPGSSKISDESFKLVGRSSLEIDNTAREHPLYHNVQPKADGLYHCPFEDDPKANCTHKPEKLKCNYEYTLFPQFLGDQH